MLITIKVFSSMLISSVLEVVQELEMLGDLLPVLGGDEKLPKLMT